ncbi:MAG: hypothetical protein AB2692_19340, partial [Candidatus Thiodiazotropha sp.]
MFVPIPDEPSLIRELESDPFIECTLQGAAGELYHRYGAWLAPLTATLITMKHMRFEHCCPRNSSCDDGGDGGENDDA